MGSISTCTDSFSPLKLDCDLVKARLHQSDNSNKFAAPPRYGEYHDFILINF